MKMKTLITILILFIVGLCAPMVHSVPVFLYSNNTVNNKFTNVHLALAKNYLLQGNIFRANDTIEAILSYDADNINALLLHAYIKEKQQKFKEAASKYKLVLKNNPDNESANFHLALLLNYLGDKEESIDYLLKSVKLMPYNELVYYSVGVVFANENNFDKAIPYFLKAVQLKPDYPEALNNACYALANLGRVNESMPYCDRAYKLNPEDGAILDSLGFAHFKSGNIQKAIEFYQKALKVDSSLYEIYLHYAQALEKNGQLAESSAYYKKYFQLNPNSKKQEKLSPKSSL